MNRISKRSAPLSDRKQTAEQWSETVELSEPIRWGAIEDEVLNRRPPRASDDTAVYRFIRGIGFVLVALLAIPTFGASLVGLLLSTAGADPFFLRLCFGMAAGVPLAMLMIWWEDKRRRGTLKVIFSAASGTISLAAYFLMRTGPVAERDGWTALLMLAAAATGLGACAVFLVASKGPDRTHRKLRWNLSPAKEKAYWDARKRVLEVLVERGAVDLHPDMQKRMISMQVGTWSRIDEPDFE